MARARQGQHRWQRSEWGAPERSAPPPRRWHVPLFAVFLAAAGGWFWQHPERLPEQLQQRVAALTADAVPATPPEAARRPIYRWRDMYGVLQFTETRPPEGVDYELVHVDPGTNTLPAGTAPWPEP